MARSACIQRRLAAMVLIAAASVAAHGREAPYTVYVTNEAGGTLSVIDGGTHQLIATLPLGKRPRGIQSSPDGKLLYVALSGSPIAGPGVDESTLPPADKQADGIGVVDVRHRRLLRIIRGVSDPEQMAVSRDGRRLYVASEDTGTVVVLEVTDGAVVAKLPVGGEPEGMTISPDGTVVYVTSEQDHRVSVLDTRRNVIVRQIPVGMRPRASAFSPDGRRAYVTSELDASVTVVDARKHDVIHVIHLPGEMVRPMGVAVSGDGKTVFVATGRGGTVVAIDAATNTVRATTKVGQRPWGVALDPASRYLYTANGPTNDVSVVDVSKMSVIATVPTGQRPWGVLALPQVQQ